MPAPMVGVADIKKKKVSWEKLHRLFSPLRPGLNINFTNPPIHPSIRPSCVQHCAMYWGSGLSHPSGATGIVPRVLKSEEKELLGSKKILIFFLTSGKKMKFKTHENLLW